MTKGFGSCAEVKKATPYRELKLSYDASRWGQVALGWQILVKESKR